MLLNSDPVTTPWLDDTRVRHVDHGLPFGVYAHGGPASLHAHRGVTAVFGNRGAGTSTFLRTLTASALQCDDAIVWHWAPIGALSSRFLTDHAQNPDASRPVIDRVSTSTDGLMDMLNHLGVIAEYRMQAFEHIRAAHGFLPTGGMQQEQCSTCADKHPPAILLMIDDVDSVMFMGQIDPRPHDITQATAIALRIGNLRQLAHLTGIGAAVRMPTSWHASNPLNSIGFDQAVVFSPPDPKLSAMIGHASTFPAAPGVGLVSFVHQVHTEFQGFQLGLKQIRPLVAAVADRRPQLDANEAALGGATYTNRWDTGSEGHDFLSDLRAARDRRPAQDPDQ